MAELTLEPTRRGSTERIKRLRKSVIRNVHQVFQWNEQSF